MDIKDTYTKVFLQAANIDISDEKKVKEYKAAWWWSFRNKHNGGLRLTEQAINFIEEYSKIKTYKIDFPNEFSYTAQILIWLDQYLDTPYFIDKKYIIVLREKSAFELYLFSGDIRKLGHNKATNKLLNQESSL